MLQFIARENPEGAWLNEKGKPVDLVLVSCDRMQAGGVLWPSYRNLASMPARCGVRPRGVVAEVATVAADEAAPVVNNSKKVVSKSRKA